MTTSIHPVPEYMRTEENVSLGRVPPTDEGLVPSQTSKDLVKCADDTAVLTEIGSDTDRFSNHGRVGTKRRR